MEEAVRWGIHLQPLRGASKAFADIPLDELQRMIRQVVGHARAKGNR